MDSKVTEDDDTANDLIGEVTAAVDDDDDIFSKDRKANDLTGDDDGGEVTAAVDDDNDDDIFAAATDDDGEYSLDCTVNDDDDTDDSDLTGDNDGDENDDVAPFAVVSAVDDNDEADKVFKSTSFNEVCAANDVDDDNDGDAGDSSNCSDSTVDEDSADKDCEYDFIFPSIPVTCPFEIPRTLTIPTKTEP